MKLRKEKTSIFSPGPATKAKKIVKVFELGNRYLSIDSITMVLTNF